MSRARVGEAKPGAIRGREGMIMAMRLGLGPVFTYEWLTTSRRWQVYAGRSFLVAALLVALVVVWRSEVVGRGMATVQQLARVGESFFYAIAGTQLALVLLAAPAATAGAICQDKARGALTHLLVTDLSDAEIVLGKLAARFVPVFGLVACALPVMALGTLLGGIDPMALTGAFLVTLGVAVLGATLALTLSVWASKTHEVLLAIYFFWAVWLLAVPAWDVIFDTLGMPSRVGLEAIDPFSLAFSAYSGRGGSGLGGCTVFFLASVAISAVLAVVAVRRVRMVASRQAGRGGSAMTPSRVATWLRGEVRWRIGPSLDSNPVLWREWHRNRPSRWGRVLGVGFALIATGFTVLAIVHTLWRGSNDELALFVNGFQAAIGLLMAAVVAATSLSEERARGSLDVLLASPMPTSAIVLGKWWGGFRVVPPVAILPGLLVYALNWKRPERWFAVPLVVGLILAYGAALASLGLALATWISRVGRVVAVTVVVHVFITVGLFFLALVLPSRGNRSLFMGMSSPFLGVALLTALPDMGNDPMWKGCVAWGMFWIVSYAMAAFLLYRATLVTFDRCLGRISDRRPRPPIAPPAKPTLDLD